MNNYNRAVNKVCINVGNSQTFYKGKPLKEHVSLDIIDNYT